MAEHGRIEIMTDRRRRRQCQPGHDGKDGGKGDRRYEAQKDIAANRMSKVDGRHVAAAP